MNNKNNAESLVGIVIGIFILSFILIGMINVIGFSKDISFNYENKIEEKLIQNNSENIISKLDTSKLQLEEEFYIEKNSTTKEFKILTGAINKDFAYLDRLGNNTSSGSEGKIFKRTYFNRIDILRHVIYPTEIPNLVFHFDANNINKNNNSGISDGGSISTWKDLSGNSLNASTTSSDLLYKKDSLNNKPLIKFNGSDYFSINNNTLIDTNTFYEKSFSIVLKTGNDITSNQTIYKQGNSLEGYIIFINNKKLYVDIKNDIDFGEILPNTIYFITVVQDSTSSDNNQKKVQIYLNGYLVNESSPITSISSHTGIRVGENFYGGIGEFISWNHALSQEEVRGVQNYFVNKWLGGVEKVRHNIIETDVSIIK